MKRFDISLVIGLVMAVLITSFTSFARDCAEVRQGVVRLHVLANSDSEADQSLKLAVRDKILEETAELFSSSTSKEEAELAVREQLGLIEETARGEVLRQGYDYPVKAELVNMFFKTRGYDGAILPAGRYDAVRVSIGTAKGKNWWCVLFPPLCVPAASEKLPVEEQIERLGQQPQYVPKLALLEFAESVLQSSEPSTPERGSSAVEP